MKRAIGLIVMAAFLFCGIVAGAMFYRQYSDAKSSGDTFSELQELVKQPEETSDPTETDETTGDTTEDVEVPQEPIIFDKYRLLYEQNNDLVGWIRIDGTGIDYPVMQMPSNPDYGFNADQNEHLSALLEEGTSSMWAAVLYGVYGEDDQIVAVAASQIGNVGGMPYWSWYGFGSRVEWCACFVSWCANECGYIDIGVIPKFAGCVNGVNWFKERGQWADGSFEPAAGMIIFFDWDSPNGSSGPQDGLSDHVGIVEKVENGVVYTIEGNTGDSCARRSYPLGHYEILGYGIPAY